MQETSFSQKSKIWKLALGNSRDCIHYGL